MDRADAGRISQITHQLSTLANLDLQCYPAVPGLDLRAWNSADALLHEYAVENGYASETILAVNDQHGALCLGLNGCDVWTDSRMASIAIEKNCQANELEHPPRIIAATDTPPGDYQLALLRIPKDATFFQHQLNLLQSFLPTGATVVCAGMDKHLSPNTAELIEAVLGSTERPRGQRKARLFVSQITSGAPIEIAPAWEISVPQLDRPVKSVAGVFSARQLDMGSRFLLEQFSKLPPARTILDLACGSGVLGLVAARQQPAAQLVFLDESYTAIQCAQHNWDEHQPNTPARFLCSDGLLDYSGDNSFEKPDLIVCNPPFHQQHLINEYFGRRLVQQAVQVLRPGGRLWLIANRHLSYGDMLRRQCSQLNKLAENRKFIAWEAITRE